MTIVGITGGIGSGKTTFCRYWEEAGVPVIYLDEYARELMNSNPEVKKQIRSTFGDQSYTEEGDLNRPYLAQQAFGRNRVEELNRIVHPAIWKSLEDVLDDHRKKGTDILAIEAAILLNKGRPDIVDQVIIIESRQQDRIQRVKKRDKAEEPDVRARMDKQPDFERLHDLADHVVINEGTLQDLRSRSIELLNEIRSGH